MTKKIFSPLYLCFAYLTLFLVRETACSIRQHKFTGFAAKLQEMAPSPSLQPHSSDTKIVETRTIYNGRVFYPIGYGADPTGVQESSDAILQALNEAFQVKGGSLRASETFPGDRHLIEVWSPNSQVLKEKTASVPTTGFTDAKDQINVGIYYEDITFRDILFDSSYRGGGMFIIESARIRINNCYFLHFSTEGILVQKGHETFISNCFLGQHSTTGGDKGEKSFTGTAIQLSSNDNAITDVAIFSAAIGILLVGQANIVTGVHCYNKATGFGGVGILVKSTASLTRIDNCYLDFTAIVMEDPVQVHVTNGFFLGDANVVLKSIKGYISGINIVNNMFNGDARNMVPIIHLDGNFSTIDQVVIEQNNVNGMSLKSTVGKLRVAGNGTKWVADFSSLLVFPDRINHFQYTFHIQMEAADAGFPVHAVTNSSNNVLVIESDKAVNGVVSVAVDQ
ncbi:hypothetical protein REPUB_Repub01dG0268800 [Reevesia pubescens]